MSTDLSPENEQFIKQAIACGVFQDRAQALDEAVALLRRRKELLDQIDEGTRQLRDGEGIVIRGDDELSAFFEGIHTEGMQRREASKKNAQ